MLGKMRGSKAARERNWVFVYHMAPPPPSLSCFLDPLATLSQKLVENLPTSVLE